MIVVFFAAMVLLNVRQSSHDIQLVHSANTQKAHTFANPQVLTQKLTCKRVCFSPKVAIIIWWTHSLTDRPQEGPEGDAKYFDFWEGKWMEIRVDNSLDTNSYFVIKQSVNAASFLEEWHSANGISAIAIRAWDKTLSKWGFVLVSNNGLYQVWDTKKVEGNWYFYKEFNVNGDKYLSRQGFLPQSDGTVLRISEKSYDQKIWQPRFKQLLRKIE